MGVRRSEEGTLTAWLMSPSESINQFWWVNCFANMQPLCVMVSARLIPNKGRVTAGPMTNRGSSTNTMNEGPVQQYRREDELQLRPARRVCGNRAPGREIGSARVGTAQRSRVQHWVRGFLPGLLPVACQGPGRRAPGRAPGLHVLGSVPEDLDDLEHQHDHGHRQHQLLVAVGSEPEQGRRKGADLTS